LRREIGELEFSLSHGCKRAFAQLVRMLRVSIVQGELLQVVRKDDFPVRLFQRGKRESKVLFPESELIIFWKFLADKYCQGDEGDSNQYKG
jgi:hypothetical protein